MNRKRCSASCGNQCQVRAFSIHQSRRMIMRNTLFFSAAVALALIATDPAFCMQDMNPPPPAGPIAPEQPVPPGTPPSPTEPMPAPAPGEPMPMPQPAPSPAPAPAPAPQPPVQGSSDAPMGPMATPPSSPTDSAQSGGTTSAMMQPQAATKAYPLCSRMVQDSCRNPGEGPKSPRRPR